MSASLVHAYEWDRGDTQRFVGVGVGRDTVFLYESGKSDPSNWRDNVFDTEDVVRTYDYSPTNPGIMGYGLNSGAVYIKELRKSANVSASTAAATASSLLLKPRVTGKCNAIAFSMSGSIVATGYEKLRGIESLLIWDLSAQSTTPSVSVNTHDTVLTAKFVPSDPTRLIFGGSRMLREYDTRGDTIIGSVPTNMCAKIAFNPHCDLLFASYGESSSVAIWDRRMFGETRTEPLISIPRIFMENSKLESRCLRFSSENGNEFAVLQDGAMIRRWQLSVTHNVGGPATQSSQLTSGLSRNKEVPEITQLPASSQSSNGIAKTFLDTNEDEGESLRKCATDCVWHRHKLDAENWSLFVNKVHDVHTETDKVVSFDYATNTSTGQLEFVCLRQSGTMFRTPVTEPPSSIYLDPFNGFKMMLPPHKLIESTKGDSNKLKVSDMSSKEVRFLLEGTQPDKTLATPPIDALSILREEKKNQRDDLNLSPDDSSENSDAASELSNTSRDSESANSLKIELKSLLSNDITCTMERRALAGYGLNAAENIALLTSAEILGQPQTADSTPNTTAISPSTSSSGLLAAWKWIKQQQGLISQTKNYLETPEIDLRYIGVLSIWDGLSQEALEHRIAPHAKMLSKTVDEAVRYAARKSPGSVYVSADDELTPYRQLCLRLTGWNFGLSELESRLIQLESKGEFEKAAGWAVFHNNIERAVESLAKSRKKHLRLMSTAVAGYLVYKDVPTNNVWREQCRKLASELSAPYLRAIFAFIADGSWLDVIDDGALPLAERLGIALRFLPQKEVGKYLSLITSRTIANGDLEGIILTGFTPKILDLLQTYLDRTGDIQTVCLLVSFGWPRFLEDSRLPNWFAEYRQLLNSWKYFSQRARLDIARNKLLASRYNTKAPPITAQAFLRCSHCKEIITRNAGLSTKSGDTSGKRKVAVNSSKHIWNKCPSCGHALPACGVCTIALGPCLDDETESDRWPMFCLRCNHGYHSVHARQWFDRYDVCPVPSCGCLCAKSTPV